MTSLIPLPSNLTGVIPSGGLSSGGGTLADFKNFFFDSKAVTDATDKATRAVLSRMGPVVMRDARASIKSRPGTSPAGTPPNAHDFYLGKPGKTGKRARRYRFKTSILFGYDPARGVLVVGPYLFAGARTRPTAPEANEKGVGGYARRPFMAPAMARNKDRFPYFFKDSV